MPSSTSAEIHFGRETATVGTPSLPSALGIFLLLGFASLALRNTTAVNTVFIYLGIGYVFLTSFRARLLVLTWQLSAGFLAVAVASIALAFVPASRLTAEDMILANSNSRGTRSARPAAQP